MIKEVEIVPDEAGLYMPDDIPAFVKKYQKRMSMMKAHRVRRNDLVKGTVVVVLEGIFASMRVVYLKSLENNLALCIGPRSVNGIPLFRIDERYLLKTSTLLKVDTNIDIDDSNVILIERDVYTPLMDVEMTSEEKKIDDSVTKAIKEIEFMKSYLSEPFEIDGTKDFYSLSH